jgi:uncharacterized protein (TIGR02231 family)
MKYKTLVALLLVAQAAIAQSPKTVDSRVVKVTVFPEGAQVTRTAHTTLQGGKSEITFAGLSSYVDASSIQVAGEGAFTILSVSPQPNKLKEQHKRKEITEIERLREIVQRQVNQQQAMQDIYIKEEKMLEANYRVGGEHVGLKALDLAAVLDLHRTRLRQLKYDEIDNAEKLVKLNDSLAQINDQINVLHTNTDVSTTELVVSIAAPATVNADFTISYVVHQASWYPSYDLHVNDISKPLTLGYKANVQQNTGEEWKDVKLTFSNGNPNESGVAPQLFPLYLSNLLTNAYSGSVTASPVNAEMMKYEKPTAMRAKSRYLQEDQASNITYAIPTQNATAITFELATPYTLISDGQSRAVDMKQEDIPCTFEYFSVPKRDKRAFLVAHIANWLDYNLMDGEVNLFNEGTYTGKTVFSLANATDTLNLSLGHDRGIIVNRTQVKEFCKKQIFSDKKSISNTYEISIRNNKKYPIHLLIEDQLPVSNDKEITVENTEYEGATLDPVSGKLSWKIDLSPTKDKKLKLAYTIKYPKTYKVLVD